MKTWWEKIKWTIKFDFIYDIFYASIVSRFFSLPAITSFICILLKRELSDDFYESSKLVKLQLPYCI